MDRGRRGAGHDKERERAFARPDPLACLNQTGIQQHRIEADRDLAGRRGPKADREPRGIPIQRREGRIGAGRAPAGEPRQDLAQSLRGRWPAPRIRRLAGDDRVVERIHHRRAGRPRRRKEGGSEQQCGDGSVEKTHGIHEGAGAGHRTAGGDAGRHVKYHSLHFRPGDLPMSDSRTPVTYRDAGVDIDAGDDLVERIKPHVKRTLRREVMGGLGGFGSLVRVPLDRFPKPVLVSGTDGVGTKLRLAIDTARHDTIGIDLVAMCANDVVVQGAEPLYFLDYYATGRLEVAVAERVVAGIAEGCVQAGCALVGGETAEMPGMYRGGDYDLAGFCVGIVNEDRIVDGSETRAGDVVIGLASSGPHSNGYSLIRKLLAIDGANAATQLDGRPLYDLLLAPTRIYVKSLLALLAEVPVHGLAHITGGGLLDNIPRVVPDGLEVRLDRRAWRRPAVFDWLKMTGNIDETELHRTFNCGIGMTVCVPADAVDVALARLRALGETATVIGEVRPGTSGVVLDG